MTNQILKENFLLHFARVIHALCKTLFKKMIDTLNNLKQNSQIIKVIQKSQMILNIH